MRIGQAFRHPDAQTAKRILCAIIQEEGGKLDGKVRLYKAFYWAHLSYFQKFSGVLSEYPMARMPQGPGIDHGEDLIFELQAEGLISVEETPIAGRNPEMSFRLTAGFKVNATDEEMEAIRDGVAKIRGKTGTQVSAETHECSRVWNRKRDGQILNIYEDLLTEDEYECAKNADQEVKAVLDGIFG